MLTDQNEEYEAEMLLRHKADFTELRKLRAENADLRERLARYQKAFEAAYPADEGYGEEQDTLVEYGVLVEVPADEEFKEDYESDTMYVWEWSPLARLSEPNPAEKTR